MIRVSAAATSAASINRVLLPTERQVFTVRQHPAILIGPTALALAGLIAAPIIAALLPARPGGLALAVWGAWLLLVVRWARRAGNWAFAFLVLTSDRIILVTGLLTRTMTIIPLRVVDDVSLQRSPAGLMLGFGEFVVASRAPDQVLQKIEYVPYPEDIYLEICNLIYAPVEVSCPLCHGAERVFQRPQEPDETVAGDDDYKVADESGQTRDSLLAAGYLEMICPRCGGTGTVAAADD